MKTSEEESKAGVDKENGILELLKFCKVRTNLELIGLMTMAPLTRKKDVVQACFARARELFAEIKGEKLVGPQFTELSMGMSADYEIAVEQGATILRIGSAIFAG